MTHCPVCGDPARLEVRRIGGYTVRECESCSLQWSDPMEPASIAWYSGEGKYAEALGERAAEKLRHVYADRLAEGIETAEWLGPNHLAFLASAPHRGGSLLDIGCGEGTFLAAAEPLYRHVAGIELDPNAASRAQHRLGERVRAVPIEELDGVAAYDVVTLFEVLEHVRNPLETLRVAARLLKPGGTLVVSVPNRMRPGADADDTDWPPNHLTRWTRSALREAFITAGLTPTMLHSQKRSRYGYWEAGWMFGARMPRVFSHLAGHSTRRWLALRRASALVWLPLWPLYAVSKRATYGLYATASR